MKVIVADSAGFCRGVRDAMEKTLNIRRETSDSETIYTFGPLIHNRQVLAMLEQKDIVETDDLDSCSGKRVIIRAHGIPPDQRKHLKGQGARITDATCKRVARVQAAIKRHARQGYQTIIVGDADHAEVIGLMGFTEGQGHVVKNPEEIDLLPEEWENVLLVAQTTQNQEAFKEVEDRFRERYPLGQVINTICGATNERQTEVRRLCGIVDAMVIVGGYNSGNTVRLAEIARESLVPTYHIETEQELDRETMSRYRAVGVSAGASTPSWMIRNVVRFLESIHPEQHQRLLTQRLFLDRLAYSNFYSALAAASLVAVVCALTRLPFHWSHFIMAGSYVFSMHTLNRYLDQEAVQFNDPERAAFYRRWQAIFAVAGLLAIAISLWAAAANGIDALMAMGFITLVGTLYSLPIMRPLWQKSMLSILKFKDIPASKTLAVPLAWAAVSTLVPHIGQTGRWLPQTVTAFWLILLLVLIRTALLDLLDVHGDRLVGRETIVVALGEAKTTRIITGLIALLTLSLLLAPLAGLNTAFCYVMIPFVCLYAWLPKKPSWIWLKGTAAFELLSDTVILAIGFVAAIWLLFS